MNNEFEFRVLTSEDWVKGTRAGLRIREDGGLELEDRDGSYTSEPLDSGIVGCRWHRIVLDAEILSKNSTLTVSFCSADKEEEEEADENWSGTVVFENVRDALVQAPPGRYIRLKIEFRRDEGEESPVLRQVKIYYPGLSYLRYLPAVYQEDSVSKDFLERFLSIFESELHDSEERISGIQKYFDPMATPDDFVPWLASWLSLDLYELLGEKNSEFILRAVEFYKQKGTVSGIAALVSLLTGRLTGRKCCVKEYMNNVFRSYGMEHEEEIAKMREYMRECTNYIEDPKGYECTKFHRETSKTVDTGYLFNWNNVPNDSKRLLRFLKDDLDIVWVENAEIGKSDDRKTISISKGDGEHSIEIIMDEKNKKATLKIRDGRTLDLKVKEEKNGKLDVYDTGTLVLLANMGKDKYCDEVHYVIDTSKDGRYSPHVIGLFIFIDAGEKLIIDEEELHKIINTFLPVFVRAKIIIVEGPFKEEYDISAIKEHYKDTLHSFWEEEYKGVQGDYRDSASWNWLYAYSAEHTDTDITNNVYYRTPHSKIGVWITL